MKMKIGLFLILFLETILFSFTIGVPLTIVNVHLNRISHGKNNAILHADYKELKYKKNEKLHPPFSSNQKEPNAPKETLNLRPIIGILSEELSYEMEDDFGYLNYTSYIAASYVKFVESAGARVAPVLIDQPDEYYEYLGRTLNGFLFPGGGLYLNSSYSKALQKIYEIAKREDVEDDKRVVIWATCLGFENVIYLEAGFDPQVHCNGSNSADNLIFQEGFESSKLLSNVLEGVIEDLATKNITANFHSKCTLPETFNNIGLNKTLKILSTSFDKSGVEYVSTIEHRQFPIFGTQWHPEKASFEWTTDSNHNKIPHSLEASRAAQAMAESFVQFARMNTNKFDSTEEEEKSLIYNFSPTFTGKNNDYNFELIYFF
ncbi:UNVERIFIED_CONTAM: hypothetical protein RMT77_016798 [Armadillidium vulgare]